MKSSLIIFNLKKNFSGDNCISEAAGDRRDVSPHDYWQGDHHHHQDHYHYHYYDIDLQVIANYGPKRKKGYPKSIHLIGTGNIEVRWDMRRQILMMGIPFTGSNPVDCEIMEMVANRISMLVLLKKV